MDSTFCQNNGLWCGPPGFNSFSSPFRKTCFSAPFTTECSDPTLNCQMTYRTTGTCYFDSECDSNMCLNGACAPAGIGFPRVVGALTYNDYLKYNSGVNGGINVNANANNAICREGMVLVNNKGKTEPYCPIPYEAGTMPVCQQTYQHLWQCDQFKDKSQPGSHDAYLQCKRFEDCFAYNVQYPDGSLHPVMVKMNSECLGAAAAAVEQTISRCATCIPGTSASCSNPAYDLLAPFVMNQ